MKQIFQIQKQGPFRWATENKNDDFLDNISNDSDLISVMYGHHLSK
jgi:hypothetical protein